VNTYTGRYFSLGNHTCLRRACFAGKSKKKKMCVKSREKENEKEEEKKNPKQSVRTDGYEKKNYLCATILTTTRKKKERKQYFRTCMVVI